MSRPMAKLSVEEFHLTRRYLIWCYKTTKEEIDRIDRYFTQLEVDKIVLKELKKARRKVKDQDYDRQVEDFADYMAGKKSRVLAEKYADDTCLILNPRYAYLQERLKGIGQAAKHFLGADGFREIVELYEKEMTRRILEAREER